MLTERGHKTPTASSSLSFASVKPQRKPDHDLLHITLTGDCRHLLRSFCEGPMTERSMGYGHRHPRLTECESCSNGPWIYA